MKPLVYLATVTTNGDYEGGTPETGVFNPVSKLLPTSEFTSLRCTFELLSVSSADLQLAVGVRTTQNGAGWAEYSNFAEDEIPGAAWASAVGWQYCAFAYPPWLDARFIQVGFYARLASTGTSRQVGVVRLRLDFKNSMTPRQEV